MNRIMTIFRREVGAYYTSPVAYALYAIFLLIMGYIFYAMMGSYSMMSMEFMQQPQMGPAEPFNQTADLVRPFFNTMGFVMLLVLPLLTMRMFSEEKKMGSIELLFTYPLKDIEVVMGKFLAAVCVFAVMVLLTVPCMFMLVKFGTPEIGPIISGYAGLLLLGAAFISLGMFTSILTENQIIAAVTAFGALIMFWVIGWAATFVEGPLSAILDQFSIILHFDNFTKGLVTSSDLTYYVLFVFTFVFLTLKSLETRKWRS